MTPIYSITKLRCRWNGAAKNLIFQPGELLFTPDIMSCQCLGKSTSESMRSITRIEYMILVIDLLKGKVWHQPFFHDFEQPIDLDQGEIMLPFHKGKLMRQQPMTDLIKGCGLDVAGFQFVA